MYCMRLSLKRSQLRFLSKCKVAIPYDGSGAFQIIGLNASALKAAIDGGFSGKGFKLASGDISRFSDALAKAVTAEVNDKAVVQGSFTSGGTFPMT